ncbi:MAG: substrate-binding domain-containing protein [Microcoleaceae cyanobacterium]
MILLALGACTNGSNPEESSASSDTQRKVRVGGSFETLATLEVLSEAYQEETEDVEFEFAPPSQTGGGIQGVKDGLLDIGAVSREIEPEEAGDLQYVALAQTPLVFIVNESVTGVDGLTTQQIKDIYAGKITNWQDIGGPDADIALLDFTEDENEKIVLRREYLGSDLEITPTAIVFAEDDELIDTVSITPSSFAAAPMTEELGELPIKVLTVDGVSPYSETLADDTYKGALDLGVVIPPEPTEATQSFMDFALSSEGQERLQGVDDDD